MSEAGVFTPDISKTLLKLMAARILPCLIACSPAAYAEVLFEETFDRPVITSNLGVTDSRLGWETFAAGEQSNLGSGSASFTGRYMKGSTTVPVNGATQGMFIKHFPLVTTGVVTLSSDVLAASSLSYASSIGLTHHKYIGRQAQWTCTTNGWIFYVGRKDQTGQYYADPPLGVDTSSQETVVIPFGVVVKLKVSVDMDRKKAWGQASWTASGVPHIVNTAEHDWDVGLSDVSMIYISQDRRSGRAGIDLDNIKVEGTRHVARPHPFLNTAHTIYQMNGTAGAIPSTAQIQWTSRDWTENGQMPYLAYMPDQSKLIMMYEAGYPITTGYMTSTDGGVTWGPRMTLASPNPVALGLVYLGGGNLLASSDESNKVQWKSTNHGTTWTSVTQSPAPTPTIYLWDPPFVTSVNGDGTSNLIRGGWLPTGVPWETDSGPYSQGHVQFSTNSGATWSNPVSVPQWLGVNEVTFVRAANGNLIAACRTDPPGRFRTTGVDHYCGLAVSISTDNGATWSALNKLYTWGRHQASMILLPNNDLLMTYIVRLGYTPDGEGFPRFGVDAVLSHDNGATWDIDHRIILAEWSGNIRGDHAWYSGVQSSSTVALPSGTVVTAFGMGFANAPDTELCVMDIGLVRWTVPSNTLNNDTYLASFDPDSDGRNIIDLKLPTGKKTLTSPFSLGYGFKGNAWSTSETSSVNTAPSGGFTLTAALSGVAGSHTGPIFTNRVLGTIATGETTYQAAIVDGFDAAFTAGYSGSAPADAATNPNYQISLNINAVSVRAAPNIDETWLQTVNFYEELPTYDLLQDPQVLVDAGNFTMLPTWDKFAWDPEEIYQPAGLITQTRARTFKLEQDASYNVFLDGLEVVGDVNLTYDAVKPTVRKTIVSTFSKGYGWKGNSWNTSETASANTDPTANFQLSIGFGSPGSVTFSNTGPTFANRVLGHVSASGTDYQCSYPAGFVATVSGGYVGTIPADAAGNPNYKIRIIVDSISMYSAPSTPSATQTLALSETTSGHTQAQTPQYVTTTGNFLTVTNWAKFAWNPSDYLSPIGILRQTQSRAFTLTESAITALAIDGFEVSGQIELSYDAEP